MRPYPWHYLVNDRPVMLVETADGGGDCLVLDWATGSFVPDRSYFGRTMGGIGKDVDAPSPEEMAWHVADRRAAIVRRMAERLAAARPTDGTALLEALGVDAAAPLFDAEPATLTEATGATGRLASCRVTAPQLVRRGFLDAHLGRPTTTVVDGTVLARYEVRDGDGGRTVVTAAFDEDDGAADARWLELTPERA